MAEVIGLAASIIAVVQLAECVAGACKSFIETVQDYPKDLRLIFVETGTLKVIFESLCFLDEDDPADSALLGSLSGPDGPVEGCKRAISQMSELLPSLPLPLSRRRMALQSLAWPLKAEKAKKLLDEMLRYKSTISVALQGQLLAEVRVVKHQVREAREILDASQKREVYNWYQVTDPSSFHNAARNLYEPGTGDWMFRTPQWDNWINRRARAFWLHGIPGAGKTVLVAHAIDEIFRICEGESSRTICVYYYCYHGNNQDESLPFLRWLLSQLLREADEVPCLAWTLFKKSREPNVASLLQALDEVLSLFDVVYLAVDALDESQRRENLLGLLGVLASDPRFQKLQLFAASREYADIERQMVRFSQPVSMSNPFVEADIKVYVKARIQAEDRFRPWPADLLRDVEEALSVGARGMFRWAVCQLDILRRLHHQSKIREAIKDLPVTLDETYERIFSSIPEEESELVRHALHFTCFDDQVRRRRYAMPASLLVESYVAFGAQTCHTDEIVCDLETIRDSCGCLLSFRADDGDEAGTLRARIAHYTVREFLGSDRASKAPVSRFKFDSEMPYARTASSILEYAMSSIITTDILHDYPTNEDMDSWNIQQYCLATAVDRLRLFGIYCQPKSVFQFLDPSEAHFAGLQEALEWRGPPQDSYVWDIRWIGSSQQSGAAILANLIMAELYGAADVFVRDLDKPDQIFQETLTWSYTRRNRNNRKTYLGNGHLVDCLVEICHTRGLRWLALDRGEEPGFGNYIRVLPRYLISHNCRVDPRCYGGCMIRHLISGTGVNPDSRAYGVTPLQIAIKRGDVAGVRALLKAGADPNSTGEGSDVDDAKGTVFEPFADLRGLAPLYIARKLSCEAESGRHEQDGVVLVRPRDEAICGYHKQIVRMLIKHGAEEAPQVEGDPSPQPGASTDIV